MRRTVTDAGAPLGIVNYDPWGTPESSTTYAYNGDGVSMDAGPTRNTQNLASPHHPVTPSPVTRLPVL